MQDINRLLNATPEVIPEPMPTGRSFSVAQPLTQPDANAQNQDFISRFCQHFSLNESVLRQQPVENLHQQVCELVSALLDGLIQLRLELRDVRHRFHINNDRYKPVHNNPLDLSVNARHALEMLFKERDDAFLSAADAIPQSVAQILEHQKALLDAALMSAKNVLKECEPGHFIDSSIARTRFGRMKQQSAAWRKWIQAHQQLSSLDQLESSINASMAKHYQQQIKGD